MNDIGMMIGFAKKFGGGSCASAPTVILPETELEIWKSNGYGTTTPPENYPEVGKTCVVTVNGVSEELLAMDAYSQGIMFSSTNWVVLVSLPEYTSEFSGYHVLVEFNENVPESCTLSIVQPYAEDAGESDNGVFTVRYTLGGNDLTNATVESSDKTPEEVFAAIASGRLAQAVVNMDGMDFYLPLETFNPYGYFMFGKYNVYLSMKIWIGYGEGEYMVTITQVSQ